MPAQAFILPECLPRVPLKEIAYPKTCEEERENCQNYERYSDFLQSTSVIWIVVNVNGRFNLFCIGDGSHRSLPVFNDQVRSEELFAAVRLQLVHSYFQFNLKCPSDEVRNAFTANVAAWSNTRYCIINEESSREYPFSFIFFTIWKLTTCCHVVSYEYWYIDK